MGTKVTFNLSGKVAVVTGGNGGIGLGIARGLAEAGSRLVLAARNEEKSRRAVQELQLEGAEALAVSVDVGDESSVENLMRSTLDHFGRLDILVNNAGMNIRKTPEKLTLPEWSEVLQVNLTGTFLCSRAAYPRMKSAGGGKIINIGSMMSLFGAPFSRFMEPAREASSNSPSRWPRPGRWMAFRSNVILPGWIDTDLTRQGRRDVPTLHDHVLRRTPAGRWGTLADCAGTAVFLASSASDFVTGASIPVDGGFSIQV